MFEDLSFGKILLVLIAFSIIMIPYFLPTIIAAIRKKANMVAILLVNLLAGWTLVGWIVALVWAVTTENVDNLMSFATRNAGQQAAARTSKLCSKCGKYSESDARFCAQCGNTL